MVRDAAAHPWIAAAPLWARDAASGSRCRVVSFSLRDPIHPLQGCGRLFEGTPEQMWSSLSKIMKLPDDTKVSSPANAPPLNASPPPPPACHRD